MEHKSSQLLASVTKNLDASGLNLRASKGARGIVLHRHSVPVALVCATHASFRGATRFEADFLVAGEHWGRLRNTLVELHARAERRAAEIASHAEEPKRVLTQFPESVPAKGADTACKASRRIRTERSLSFGHTVIVRGPSYDLGFDPVSNRSGPVELPFFFQPRGAEQARAALRLRTPNDPLAVVFPESVREPEAIRAWLIALVAFSELTCVEPSVQSEPLERGRTHRRSHPSENPRPPRQPGGAPGALRFQAA